MDSSKIDDLYIYQPGGSVIVSLSERAAFFDDFSFEEDSLLAINDDDWLAVQNLLVAVIRSLRVSYYQYATNIVPDHVFDRLFRGLQKMEALRPSEKVDRSPTDEIE